MPAPTAALRAGSRVHLRRPRASDLPVFIRAVAASRRLHSQWVQAPSTATRFGTYVKRFAGPKSRRMNAATHVGLFACRNADGAPVGVFNFSEIIYGAFRSAYLGYYALEPFAGQGYMSEGLALAIEVAFLKLRLHRIEVNVQPSNTRSTALVRSAGFTREGFSPRYVKIAGRWRDHERWALLIEDWRARRKTQR